MGGAGVSGPGVTLAPSVANDAVKALADKARVGWARAYAAEAKLGRSDDVVPTPATSFQGEWVDALLASDMPALSKLVGLAMARFADYATGCDVRPGLARVVRLTSLSDASVK